MAGKLVAGSIAGRYGIALVDDKITGVIQTSAATYVCDSGIIPIVDTWYAVSLVIDQTNGIMKVYINGTQSGSNTNISGVFSALDDVYSFKVGGGSALTTGLSERLSDCSFDYTSVYRRVLTESEIYSISQRNYYAVILPQSLYMFLSPETAFVADLSGNSYHLNRREVGTDNVGFDTIGTTMLLDNGYFLYSDGVREYYLPKDINGDEIEPAFGNIGVKKVKYINGSLNKHNLANSVIVFRQDFFDRSDTDIYEDVFRGSDTYYDITNTKSWHVSELNNLLNKIIFKTGHEGRLFVKMPNNTYNDRDCIDNILLYCNNKENEDYNSILTFTKDLPSNGIYETNTLFYKEENDYILFVRDNKLLKYEGGRILLSTDNGLTYPYEYKISGRFVHFGFIFNNGNILFANESQLYFSDDNLETVTNAVVKDIEGNDYIADYSYLSNNITYETIGEIEYLLWGTYRLEVNGNDPDINVWFTKDNGTTVRSIYKAATTTPPNLPARHIHGLTYKSNDNTWWLVTGDNNFPFVDENNVIKGVYDDVLDIWTWERIAGNGHTYKLGHIAFVGDTVIAADDNNLDGDRRGYWYVDIADILDESKFSQAVFNKSGDYGLSLIQINGQLLGSSICNGIRTYIMSSISGIDNITSERIFTKQRIQRLFSFYKPNNQGWYFMHKVIYGKSRNVFKMNGGVWVKFK